MFFELPYESTETGSYGCFAIRKAPYDLWTCYLSSDYKFYGVTDDFGDIVPVSSYENLRGY